MTLFKLKFIFIMSTESDQTSSVAPETVEVEKKKPFNVS